MIPSNSHCVLYQSCFFLIWFLAAVSLKWLAHKWWVALKVLRSLRFTPGSIDWLHSTASWKLILPHIRIYIYVYFFTTIHLGFQTVNNVIPRSYLGRYIHGNPAVCITNRPQPQGTWSFPMHSVGLFPQSFSAISMTPKQILAWQY